MLCFNNPKMDAGEPKVWREGKLEWGGPWPSLHRWVNETAYEKRPIQGKSLFSVSRNVRTKSLPRTRSGLKRGQGSINFTGSVAASCLCLSQEAAKAGRVEELGRVLDKFGEKQVTVKRSCGSGRPVTTERWLLSGDTSGGLWAPVLFPLRFALSICYRPPSEAGYGPGATRGLTSQSGSYVPPSHWEMQMCRAGI